ncbi:trehalase / alfa-L-rhamnosidase / mannosyl oligosaccharide glucosidase [Sporanaerobium hydrogeniformans]|uniref:Trehalase / alfa-L-rhamnosidase / mannosyl oligosaccharide glucosidase n=1 Tax=Sporanaerobium hydrogeniformans TaxID=3072179 RepID=A0AC61DCH0_9FIRM|nr:trehalase family glycosidase [Sporanaerobium hydrogeniformans]PHV70450.1 trehalase / alfa-L-rhamnosidase / mannosyl oligosaccharide glucosidase [Sporanaerobium hydrogeniformans]
MAYLEMEKQQIKDYILKNLKRTLKEANDYLKYPFIDPGSVYDGNLWDWDSFWATYALLNMTKEIAVELKEKVILHAKGNIYNFFDNQLEDGYIPMMIEKTELKEPYLNIKHKEGVIMNMCKPFLCQQIGLISGFIEDYTWVLPYKEKIKKYFDCYKKYYYNPKVGLYVWADDIMIGIDNDPSSFGRPKFSTANIYLNSFMVSELKAAIKLFRAWQEEESVQSLQGELNELIENINKECWDKRDAFYYSVDVDICTREFDWFHKGLGVFWNTLPIKIRSCSSLVPLYVGFPSKKQAEAIKNHLLDPTTFGSPWGITSLAMDEKMYNLEATNNPSNWLGPIWMVTQYLVFRGLMNYGYTAEAKALCERIIQLLSQDIQKTGTLHEFYHPMTGEPIMNAGFMNWNMLVINMMDELEQKSSMYELIF